MFHPQCQSVRGSASRFSFSIFCAFALLALSEISHAEENCGEKQLLPKPDAVLAEITRDLPKPDMIWPSVIYGDLAARTILVFESTYGVQKRFDRLFADVLAGKAPKKELSYRILPAEEIPYYSQTMLADFRDGDPSLHLLIEGPIASANGPGILIMSSSSVKLEAHYNSLSPASLMNRPTRNPSTRLSGGSKLSVLTGMKAILEGSNSENGGLGWAELFQDLNSLVPQSARMQAPLLPMARALLTPAEVTHWDSVLAQVNQLHLERLSKHLTQRKIWGRLAALLDGTKQFRTAGIIAERAADTLIARSTIHDFEYRFKRIKPDQIQVVYRGIGPAISAPRTVVLKQLGDQTQVVARSGEKIVEAVQVLEHMLNYLSTPVYGTR